MSNSKGVILASKASKLRWIVLAIIVGFGFSADFLLKRDVSSQVSDAWFASCSKLLAAEKCQARVQSQHAACFDLAYTSMIFTFGRERWESFKLLDYEACMNRDKPQDQPGSPTRNSVEI